MFQIQDEMVLGEQWQLRLHSDESLEELRRLLQEAHLPATAPGPETVSGRRRVRSATKNGARTNGCHTSRLLWRGRKQPPNQRDQRRRRRDQAYSERPGHGRVYLTAMVGKGGWRPQRDTYD